jgi:hypothetical protein
VDTEPLILESEAIFDQAPSFWTETTRFHLK